MAWAGTGWSRPSEGTGRESEGEKTKRDKVSKLLQLCGFSTHSSVKLKTFIPLPSKLSPAKYNLKLHVSPQPFWFLK